MNNNMTQTSTSAADSISQWIRMWNSGGDIARHICSDGFRIHFANSEPDGSNPADELRGAEAFAVYLDRYRKHHSDIVFTSLAEAVDGRHGRLIWNAQAGDVRIGGVDVFDFTDDGLIDEVWSVGGTRPLAV